MECGAAGGFSTAARTWLPVNTDYARVNVAAGWREPDSLLRWTARLIALRRSEPALRDGVMTLLDAEPDVLGWTRTAPGNPAVLVAINMGDRPRMLTLPGGRLGRTLASSDPAARVPIGDTRLRLPPFTVWIGRLS